MNTLWRWINRLICCHKLRSVPNLAEFYTDTDDLWPATCLQCGHVRMITGKQFVQAMKTTHKKRRLLPTIEHTVIDTEEICQKEQTTKSFH